MRKLLLVGLAVLLTLSCAVADSGTDDVIRDLTARALDNTIHDAIADISPGGHFDALPLGVRISWLSGTDSCVSLVQLGDKSPLKAHVPAQVWSALVERLPKIQAVDATIKASFAASLAADLARKDLGDTKALVGTANLALAATQSTDDVLSRATLVYSAKAVCSVLCTDAVRAALMAIAIDLSSDADLREEAGRLVALGAAAQAASAVAEAQLRAQLGITRPVR